MNKLTKGGVAALATVGTMALTVPASAVVTVPAAFTVDYDAIATQGMTAAGAAITAGIVVLAAIWAIKVGLRLFKRIASA